MAIMVWKYVLSLHLIKADRPWANERTGGLSLCQHTAQVTLMKHDDLTLSNTNLDTNPCLFIHEGYILGLLTYLIHYFQVSTHFHSLKSHITTIPIMYTTLSTRAHSVSMWTACNRSSPKHRQRVHLASNACANHSRGETGFLTNLF